MSRILIAGCGYVGSALADRLVEAGHEVFGMRRHPPKYARFERVAADLTAPRTLRIPALLDVAFYTAAPDVGDETAYRRVYIEGLKNLMMALPPATRVLFTSSTAVYAQDDGSVVDELSKTEPRSYRGRVLLEAEALLSTRWSASTLRLAGIYGPGRMRALDAVRSGTARYVPGRYMNLIHRQDAAGALAHLMTLDKMDPLYLGVDEEPVESGKFYRWLARQTGSPAPREDAPNERGRNKRCASDRLRASGFRFRFPTFRDGFRSHLR